MVIERSNLFSRLSFLIATHNCVAIPNFGGFILNKTQALVSLDRTFSPPKWIVTFNSDLRHDDGILTSHISKDKNIPYSQAGQLIKNFVQDIKSDLYSNKTVQCGCLGILSLDENKNILFEPNTEYVHPALYGLTSIDFNKLTHIESHRTKEKKRASIGRIAGAAVAATIAIAILVIPTSNIEDTSLAKTSQQAGFIHSLSSTKIHLTEIGNNTIQADSILFANPKSEEIMEPKSTQQTPAKPISKFPKYYIVVGGDVSKLRAENFLRKIQNANFPNAKIVESADRHRIYIASFHNKKEAEKYLVSFRQQNTKHQDAWLYSKPERR